MTKIMDNSKNIIRFLIPIAFVIFVFYSIPKEGKFKYEYSKYELWQHEDLSAPFTFPIHKTQKEIDADKKKLINSFLPFYSKLPNVSKQVNNKLIEKISDIYIEDYDSLSENQKIYILSISKQLIDDIYKRGIISIEKNHFKHQSQFYFTLVFPDKTAKELSLSDVIPSTEVSKYLENVFNKKPVLRRSLNIESLSSIFVADIIYNEELSETKINNELSNISLNKGLVYEGQKIISKNVKVTPEKFQILESLRLEYESSIESKKKNYLMYIGYFLLIIIITGSFVLYIFLFYKKIFNSTKDLLLIFLTILLFILLSTWALKIELINIYLIPFCIVPILLLSFYDARIGFISHMITVLIISIFAPNNFEFLFIQIIAGLGVILGIYQVKYLSQFFITVLTILFVYYFSYFGIKLIQVNAISEIEFSAFIWFTGSFILTLLAYPLIFAYEKVFGLLSDITLVELSDLNKKLLRELSKKAPGTFQHSVQVSNISEAVLNKIGGNSLLARVGALYHDIGKMHAPQYYIENQKGFNPHDELNEKESAEIIVKHVRKGVEYAKEHKLPKEIVDFIKTHHGTSRAEFFYRNYKKKHPDEKIDESIFTYPGPRPIKKETAVVMIVDSIEAASKSLKNPSEKDLEKLVDDLVENKLTNKQLSMANISLKEIRMAKGIIKLSLKTIYHSRIEYPKEN
ncbi:MAG: HDIG domain-containing protein [Bacteroidota bacterium]|nr:HDIG domain-containing protein [Bacteroidota bacterium]